MCIDELTLSKTDEREMHKEQWGVRHMIKFVSLICSGQIIATSHDLTSHGRVVGDPALNGLIYFREIQVGEIL